MKKIFGMLLILCVFVCTLAFTFSVDAANGVLAKDDEGYYKIEDTADLDALANGTLWQTAGNKFRLYSDLTYTDTWTSPKFGSVCFNGTFDGNNYTITYTMSGGGRGALFTQAGKGAKILNLTVNATINSTASADIGAIVAIGLGDLTIENCTVNGSITGKQNVGGVIGRWRAAENAAEACNDGTTTLSVSATVNASVTGSNGRTGGMIGHINYHKGICDVDIDVLGNVNGSVSGTDHVGGVVGYLLVEATANEVHDGTIDIDVNVNAVANAGDSNEVKGTNSKTGGFVGYAALRQSAGTITLNVKGSNCKNVTGKYQAGGAIGDAEIANAGGAVDLIVTAGNEGDVLGTDHVGGVVGRAIFNNTAGTASLKLGTTGLNVTNEGAVSGSSNAVGGILGYAEIKNTGVAALSIYAINSADVDGNGVNVGGIAGHINGVSGRGAAVTVSECTNNNSVNGSYQVGGIIGRIETAVDFDVTISECCNNGTVTAGISAYKDGRAGGIVGFFYDTSNDSTSEIFTCWNNGIVTADGNAVGGIAGATVLTNAGNLSIEHCLNSATITSTINDWARIGGIVGDYAGNSSYYPYTLKCSYNSGKIVAPDATNKVGHIIGLSERTDWAKHITNVHYSSTVDSPSALNSVGTEKSAYEYVTLNEGEITGNWVYSRKNNEIELKYFHDALENHSEMPSYRLAVDSGNCYCYCESINCTEELADSVPVVNISAVINVNEEDGYTEETLDDINPVLLGSENYPCKTLTLANECVARYQQLGADVNTIAVEGTVSVPSDYHLPAASGGMTLTGNGNGTLKFDNNSPHNETKHFHIDGDAVIKNITVLAVDEKGIFFYADNHSLTMGDGVEMDSELAGCEYYVEDMSGVKASPYLYAGARAYVIGGVSVNEWLYENLDAEEVNELEGYLAALEGGEVSDDQLSEYIADLAGMAISPPEVNSNITVRSGQYRSVTGWHDEFFFCDDESDTRKPIVYNQPITGTTNIIVGSSDEGDLQITHLSPFGYDYQSFGENCTANVTVDGTVVVWNYNFGAHVKRMTQRVNGVGSEIGENKYPLITNINLCGNIVGPADEDVVNYIKPSTYYWGFNAKAASDFGVLVNVTFDQENAEAVKDAHAFLGHNDSYCSDESCTGAEPCADITKYAHRNIAYIGVCDCGGEAEKLDTMPATCITLPIDRMVCSDCGGFNSAVVSGDNVDANSHIESIQLAWIKKMAPTETGVSVIHDGVCRCFGVRECNISSEDGTFYVNETNYLGEADYYKDGIGSIEVPFNDFATAYRVAKAYASEGREATVVIIAKASIAVGKNTELDCYGADAESVGKVVIKGAGSDSELLFRNPSDTQSSVLLITGDVEFNTLKLKVQNPTINGAPARIRIFACNNTVVMGTGLNMPDASDNVNAAVNNNFMLFGGFNTTPDVAMCTNLTVRSGLYYYIGAWNYDALATYDEDGNVVKDGIVTGEGKLTIGDPDSTNEDVITTYYLSLYGVGAETTKDTKSVLHVYGNINVTTLEATAQNGIANGEGGSNAPAHADNRVSDIYIYDTANFNVENVHINGEQIIGDYTVNVLVENSATDPSIRTVHMLCGHDKDVVNGEGRTNYRHINTFHQICTSEDCPYDQSDVNSYLFNSGTNAGEDCYISVNVYDMALYTEQGAPVINYSISTGTDSGVYYPGNIVANGPMGGVVRFLFKLEATSTDCELDSDYAKDIVEESFIRYLFTNVSKDSEDNIAETSKSGTANHFRADVYDIPVDTYETYYAVGVVKLKDGTELYSDIIPAKVEWTNPVAYYSDVVEEV